MNLLSNALDQSPGAYFHRQARRLLDGSDETEAPGVPPLFRLQATVLTGLYELQNASFGRAWLTANRATWLVQELGLHQLDVAEYGRGNKYLLMHELSSSLNEARKILWATVAFKCFFSLGDLLQEPTNTDEVGNADMILWQFRY